MKCPRCQGPSAVLSTRGTERRRKCSSPACGHRFTTMEFTAAEIGQMRADSLRLARMRNLFNEGQP